MGDREQFVVRVLASLEAVDAAEWDACANADPARFNPFVAHAFLKALEDAKCIGGRSGWRAHHLVLEDGAGGVAGVLPLYSKTHSQGEYVFDHHWVDAYERAGGRYYPKLLAAVPFTPVPGPRLLVKPGAGADERRRALAAGAVELLRQNELSSLHITFLEKEEAEALEPLGFLTRTGTQFHWVNQGYKSFEDFLGELSSRKRKTVKKERAEALAAGIEIEWIDGDAITEAHWDRMYEFYMDTGNRKWGQPYLNRKFFSRLGETMRDKCLLIFAKRAGNFVAGAMNMIGGECLYGRYWGALEEHPCLHFEVCYYQAMDYAIKHGLKRVEAGAQGEHKLFRGYLPVTTYSAHWIRDANFRAAIANFLERERKAIAAGNEELAELGPFKCKVGG
jgi:uncharacterized protein